MVINLLVAAVTLLMAGFVLVWLVAPRLRGWMEAPKHRFLENQRRFPDIVRDDKEPLSESSGRPPARS